MQVFANQRAYLQLVNAKHCIKDKVKLFNSLHIFIPKSVIKNKSSKIIRIYTQVEV